jgi:hypothetical protein
MSFLKSKQFKYLKNLVIGAGASVVLVGALFKILSWPYANEMLTVGLLVEAGLFLMLGLLGPENDYYWEKLYPGLDKYDAQLKPLTDGPVDAAKEDRTEQQLEGMLTELKTMSKSLGSLKALQEVDFSKTSDQVKAMSNFYENINNAMADLNNTVADAKQFRENMSSLNSNLNSLNSVYGGMLSAMSNIGK